MRSTRHDGALPEAGEDWFDRWKAQVYDTFVPLQAASQSGAGSAFKEGLCSQELGYVQLSEVAGDC